MAFSNYSHQTRLLVNLKHAPLGNVLPEKECHLSFRNLGPPSQPCLANSNQTHCLSYTNRSQTCLQQMFLQANWYQKKTGTNIYCKTSSLAFLSWCPPITIKMMQSLHGVVSTHTKSKVAWLLMSTVPVLNPQPTIHFFSSLILKFGDQVNTNEVTSTVHILKVHTIYIINSWQ
jgi:hypothetical protein